MIRTTVVGSWPVDPAFETLMAQYHRGELSPQEADLILTEVARVAIGQQRACGLDEYTGGETWADTFVLHFPKLLGGIVPAPDTGAWGWRGNYEVVGELTAPDGLGVASAYRRERGLDTAISKVNIPGPSEITMMLGPAETRSALRPRAIELIREEMSGCIEAGVLEVQIDLPHVAMGLVDEEWTTEEAVDVITALFADFDNIRRSIHLCYGDFGAQTWTKNRCFHRLLPAIQNLGGVVDRLVLEFSLPEQWAERTLLAELPGSMEVAAGIVDVKSPQTESSVSLARRIDELLEYVPAQRLLICPSCGLGRRNVRMAVDKVSAMVLAVNHVNGVPGQARSAT